jgi:2-polyprenyl-3-methyl-5-hydroxy-6-metoxy-1,4-benzoquinol methylase
MSSNNPALFSDKILACLKAPDEAPGVERIESGFRSLETGLVYEDADDLIPSLFMPTKDEGEDVTTRVKSFYEETPFPNYEGIEDYGELVSKGSNDPLTVELLKAIGYNKLILECGCGTGQMSHYLQLNNNHVLGIDMSLGSLKLAVQHKLRNQLVRSNFCQMNIFNLAIKDNTFDVVISRGVLHHTYNARKAFGEIVKKVKPGGIVMVGLYNRPARFPTWARSKLIRLFGPRIDDVVRTRIKDQYFNPHETWHSIDETMDWFEQNEVEFLNCSPPILGTDGESATNLFTKTRPGSAYQRQVTQFGWLASIAREGALFDLIGRKKG